MKIEWDFHEFEDFATRLTEAARFEEACKVATEEIARSLLTMLRNNTPVETGKLKSGWDGTFEITRFDTGFEVVLKNTVEYASHVNDGHKAYNQFGGPYKIHNRVKVKTPHPLQKGDLSMFVFGHFFVENSILQLNDTKQIEQIIYKQLQKWWKGCFNG